MTTIDDSNNTPASTPPGYWFGEIESRLHDRMRSALAEQDLRRGGWRLLHTLTDGPATAEELADRLPRGRGGFDPRPNRGDRGSGPRGFRGHGGFDPRPQGTWTYSREIWHAEPALGPRGGRRDHDGPGHGFDRHDYDGRHPDGHHDRDGHSRGHGHGRARQAAFERGFERGFQRGYAAAPPIAGPFGGPAGFRGARGFRGAPGFGFGPQHGHDWTPSHGRGPCSGDRRVARVERILADFTERGWVWFDGDEATLTDEGRAAHDAAFAKVREVRESLTAGISDEDYATTIAALETMARNLGWEPRAADDTAADTTGDPANASTDGPTDTETGDSTAS